MPFFLKEKSFPIHCIWGTCRFKFCSAISGTKVRKKCAPSLAHIFCLILSTPPLRRDMLTNTHKGDRTLNLRKDYSTQGGALPPPCLLACCVSYLICLSPWNHRPLESKSLQFWRVVQTRDLLLESVGNLSDFIAMIEWITSYLLCSGSLLSELDTRYYCITIEI